MITLTDTEVQQFTNLRAQAVAGTIGYWQIYQTLADLMVTKGAPATDQSLLWLRGATEANADRGAMAALIRTYTDTQHQLRYGVPMPSGKMQEASNAIANKLLDDIEGKNAPFWPKGQVPDIARIAFADARAVGAVLFNGDLNDTAAELQQNSAWSGSLLFSLLRSDQTGKLISTGTPGSIDTLNDWRDVLYAAASYAKALPAADTAFWAGGAAQKLTDGVAVGTTVLGYFNGGHTTTDLWNTVVSGTSGGVVGDALSRIGNVGPNKFLDMLMGAVQGKSLIGTATDVNFAANAQTFLGSLSATQLQAISAKLLPIDASGLTVAASANTAEGAYARAALAALSVVSVQTSNAVAAQFSLYSPATGQGNISALWISDRAAFTVALYTKLQSLGGIVNGSNNLRYFDASSNTEVLVGAGSAQRAQYLFGGQGADALNGQGFADHLYGGAGNDIFNGLGGNDYLEGGAGIDTYQFSGTWGLDTIVDTDGQGFIQIDGTTLTGGAQYGDARVSKDAQGNTYTQVGNGRLIVNGSIIIEGFSAGILGLTMTGAVVDVNPVTSGPVILGDLQTNPLNFGIANMGSLLSQRDMHSQALLKWQ